MKIHVSVPLDNHSSGNHLVVYRQRPRAFKLSLTSSRPHSYLRNPSAGYQTMMKPIGLSTGLVLIAGRGGETKQQDSASIFLHVSVSPVDYLTLCRISLVPNAMEASLPSFDSTALSLNPSRLTLSSQRTLQTKASRPQVMFPSPDCFPMGHLFPRESSVVHIERLRASKLSLSSSRLAQLHSQLSRNLAFHPLFHIQRPCASIYYQGPVIQVVAELV